MYHSTSVEPRPSCSNGIHCHPTHLISVVLILYLSGLKDCKPQNIITIPHNITYILKCQFNIEFFKLISNKRVRNAFFVNLAWLSNGYRINIQQSIQFKMNNNLLMLSTVPRNTDSNI